MKSRLALLLAAATLSLACSASADNNRILIDPSVTHQTMTGWEIAPRIWEMDKENHRYDGSWLSHREDIAKALVKDVGINRIRLEIASGAENPTDYWRKFTTGEIGYQQFKDHLYEKINDNNDPETLAPGGFQFAALDYYVENLAVPMKRLLEARGERLIVNLCYVDFKWTKLKGRLSHADNSAEYAELIDAAALHLANKYGITPDFVEIILEPDNTDRWSGGAIADALVATNERLAARGLRPRYIAPSTAHAGRAARYFDDLSRNKRALSLLNVISYHRYDGPRAEGALAGINARAKEAGASTEMLEYVQGRVDHLFSDIEAGAAAWQRYGAAAKTDASGRTKPGYLLAFQHDALSIKPDVVAMAQVFRHVREGAVRLEARALSSTARPLAFKNSDGRHMVAILTNSGGPYSVEGLPAGRYQIDFAPRGGGKVQDLGPFNDEAGDPIMFETDGPGIVTIQENAPFEGSVK